MNDLDRSEKRLVAAMVAMHALALTSAGQRLVAQSKDAAPVIAENAVKVADALLLELAKSTPVAAPTPELQQYGDVGKLPEHLQRVVAERVELVVRLTALTKFLQTAQGQNLPAAEFGRLQRQAGLMTQYAEVLLERIQAGAP